MKRVTLLLILVVIFSCKNEKNKKVKEDIEKKYRTVKDFTIDDLIRWNKIRVDLEPATDVEFSDAVYRLSRNSITEAAYLTSGLIPVTYASKYRVSIVVKKGTNNNIFGLRLSGVYPDRVDAVFDLEKGTVVEYKISQDFEDPLATIESLGGGWYKCVLSAEVSADDVKVIIGATTSDKKVEVWEGKTKILGDVYLIPSSISIEEEVF